MGRVMTFDVLAEPARRQILDLLLVEPRSVNDLVELLGMTQPGTSKHLRVLRDAGLVSVRKDGPRRWYELRPEPLVEVDAWLAPYRRYWAGRLDALERHLDAMPDEHVDARRTEWIVNGNLLRIDGRNALRFERRLPHPPEKVWRALTDPAQLSQWFPATPEWELAAGAKIRFSFPEEAPTDDFVAADYEGEIVTVDPPRLFVFTWSGEVLSWELAPDGDGTRLTFQTIFDDVSRASRDAAGWDVCLEMLDLVLDGTTPPPQAEQMRRWDELFAGYVGDFGPEASAQGRPEGM